MDNEKRVISKLANSKGRKILADWLGEASVVVCISCHCWYLWKSYQEGTTERSILGSILWHLVKFFYFMAGMYWGHS